MRTLFSVLLGTFLTILMIAAPLAYKRMRDRESRNFRVVEEGVLYRSGQLTLAKLEQIRANYGIRTIVSLRENKTDCLDEAEENWATTRGLNFVRIPYRTWYPDATGQVPAEESVKKFREIMADSANYPVLVHCFAGIHRTGTMCAVFRMDFQNWTNEQAMAEMRALGYTILDDHEDVRSYMSKYRPRTATNKTPAIPVARQKNSRP